MAIKVCIDPGHGGKDRSNKGPTGYIEADGVLDISLKLRDELLSTGAFEVKLSRDRDMTLGVRERGNMAAQWKADMFISEHSNATGLANNNTRRGVDVYSSVDLKDEVLAKKMADAVAVVMGTKGSALKRESQNYPGEDYYGVIDAAQDGGVKHVLLIENGFHDNAQDEAVLKDPAKRTAIAKAQAKVICDFYGVQYPVIKKEEPDMWKKNIVKEAFELGLITDQAWVDKADEEATVWFVLAVAINLFKKLKGK